MKLGPLFSLLSAVEGAGRYLVEKDEASEFLSRQGKLFMINWDITSLYVRWSLTRFIAMEENQLI